MIRRRVTIHNHILTRTHGIQVHHTRITRDASMKPEDYSALETAVKPFMAKVPFSKYQEKGLSGQRYRWDLLNASGFNTTPLYKYLNDSSIDTALKRITGVRDWEGPGSQSKNDQHGAMGEDHKTYDTPRLQNLVKNYRTLEARTPKDGHAGLRETMRGIYDELKRRGEKVDDGFLSWLSEKTS